MCAWDIGHFDNDTGWADAGADPGVAGGDSRAAGGTGGGVTPPAPQRFGLPARTISSTSRESSTPMEAGSGARWPGA